MKQLLVIDDDYSMRTILRDALSNCGYKVDAAKDGKMALEIIASKKCELVITDLMMPEINGIELMEMVKKDNPSIGFLIITAYGTIETAVEALRKGAFDFITKPFSISQIESRVQRYFDFEGLKEENKELKRKLSYDDKFNRFVGKSKAMQTVFQQIEIVATSDVPVFVEGESGTGKELIAQEIHENSDRNNEPFLKVNCSAIPESLFESTLFGHEKGAFTHAINTHKGLFEDADNGTLLLDEISEMPLTMQAKLLRVLQERTITRIGSTKEIEVDVRVIATSNSKIQKLVNEDKFRSDLWFRLNVFPIKISPLRARPEDIPVYIDHFLNKFQSKYKYQKKVVHKETLDALMRQNWPGNVRQLENLLERAILYSGDEPELSLEYFSLETEQFKVSDTEFDDVMMSIAEMEKKLILNTLKRTNDNRTQAANILGISVRTLRNKLGLYDRGEAIT